MYCLSCGHNSENTATHCQRCGFDLSVSGIQFLPTQYMMEKFNKKHRKKKRGAPPPPPPPPVQTQQGRPHPPAPAGVQPAPRPQGPEGALPGGVDGGQPGAPAPPEQPPPPAPELQFTVADVPPEDLQGSMKTAPPWFMRTADGDTSPFQPEVPEKPAGPMRVVKLVLGIVGIALAALVAGQLLAAPVADLLPGPLLVQRAAVSLVLAAFLLAAGILGIVTRDSKPGGIVSGFVFLLGAVAGFVYPGALDHLLVFAVASLALAAVFIVGSVRMDGSREAPVYRRVWFWIAVALSALLMAALFLGFDPLSGGAAEEEPAAAREDEGPKYGEAPEAPAVIEPVEEIVAEEPPEEEPLTYGDIIVFDGLELLFGEEITWDAVDGDLSANADAVVAVVPVAVKNLGTENHKLDITHYTLYGTAGLPLDKVGAYFQEDLGAMEELEPDTAVETVLHILYDGDGDYAVEFAVPFGETIAVRLPISRTADGADADGADGAAAGADPDAADGAGADEAQAADGESAGGLSVILPS